jgi:hypothetical protein
MYAIGGAGGYTGGIVAAVLKDDVRHCGPTPTCVYCSRRGGWLLAPRCRSLAMRENREVAELCCGNTL